jgi:hypothetical protein
MHRFWIFPTTLALLVTGSLLGFAHAQSLGSPKAFTTYTGSHTISYDSFGNPAQASLTLNGLPNSSGYKVCIEIVAETKPAYNDFNYGTRCQRFSFGKGDASTQTWGTNFPFGGPAEYRVTWSVPPTFPPVTSDTFAWANKNSGDLSPCPPDPKLMLGVWVPGRLKIVNRCRTWQSTVRTAPHESGDGDFDWTINWPGGLYRQAEYMPRDIGRLRPNCSFDCSLPKGGETWKLTGVYVCDTYHGHNEFHPVFMAQQIVSGTVVRTLLSGPQYSTQTWQGPYPTFDYHTCPDN